MAKNLIESFDAYREVRTAAKKVSGKEEDWAKACLPLVERLETALNDLKDGKTSARKKIDSLLSIEESMELADFFKNVSKSMIGAQDDLNDRSLDYVTRSRRKRLPPSYFAIPNVKAEMKVGFNRATEKGMNVILFKSSTQKQEYAESTVSFELVAAPPPPGPDVVPPWFLVLGVAREDILDKSKQALEEEARKTPQLGVSEKDIQSLRSLMRDYRSKALVLRYDAGEAGRQQPTSLVVWPTGKSLENWGRLVVFRLKDDAQPALDPDAFENEQPYLLLKDAVALKSSTKEDLAKLAISLGDALHQVTVAIDQWLQAIQFKSPDETAGTGNA
jgi:hypothetical protein